MPIDTSRDDVLGPETEEERRAQIEQYVLSQPWRRRPRLAIPLRMDNISTYVEIYYPDISEEWESRDPTTEVPIAKRIIDMEGDEAANFLDSNPVPDNLNQAEKVEYILRSTLRGGYPEIGEERVISKQIVGGGRQGRLVLVFEDGSTMRDGDAYDPGHPRSKKIVDGTLSDPRWSSSSLTEAELDTLRTLRAMASQNKVPRPPVQFWEGLVNTETKPQVVEAVSELKNQQEAEKDLRAREKKLEQSQSSSLDQTSHYVPRRGRGGQDMRRT